MGERLPCKQEVTSSTLVFSTWQRKLLKIKYSSLAQSVEHSAVNRSVVGSSPTGGAEPFSGSALFSRVSGFFFFRFLKMEQKRGRPYDFQPLKLFAFPSEICCMSDNSAEDYSAFLFDQK